MRDSLNNTLGQRGRLGRNFEKKLDYLPSLGKQAREFRMPVIKRFIRSFDQEETKDFWNKIAHHEVAGCGVDYLSGWITAFCFWNSEGNQLYHVEETTGALSLDDVLHHY